jgi:tRNA pseudouridine55 synthase
VEFEVACSKGTYVRTLAADVGEALGCGAHLGRLTRTRVGPFTMEDAVSLADLEAMGSDLGSAGFSMFSALPHLPIVRVGREERAALGVGATPAIEIDRADERIGKLARVTSDGSELVALANVVMGEGEREGAAGLLKPVKVFVESYESPADDPRDNGGQV